MSNMQGAQDLGTFDGNRCKSETMGNITIPKASGAANRPYVVLIRPLALSASPMTLTLAPQSILPKTSTYLLVWNSGFGDECTEFHVRVRDSLSILLDNLQGLFVLKTIDQD